MKIRRRTTIAWAALAAALSVMCCDRIGDPLVEYDKPPMQPLPSLGCTPTIPCDEAAIVLPDDHLHMRSIAPACGRPRNSCSEIGSQDDDAGSVDLPAGCLHIGDNDEIVQSTLQANCEDRFVEIEKPLSGTSIELSGVDWRASNIGFSSRDPSTIELDGASMEDVVIQLSGPVTLRITHPAKLEEVRVMSGRPSSGEPVLELLEVDGDLVVGDATEAFHGTLRAKRTMLATPQLIADRIALESVTFKDAIIEADELSASDASITNATFALGNAVISASTLFNAHVLACGSLALLVNEMGNLRVPACSTPPLRVYRSSVVRGFVDGEIESDLSSWTRVAFGLHASTNLIGWADHLTSCQFCPKVESLEFGTFSVVKCSHCDDSPEDEPATCMIPPTPTKPSKNYCPAVKKAPACKEPLPVRHHPEPISNFF